MQNAATPSSRSCESIQRPNTIRIDRPHLNSGEKGSSRLLVGANIPTGALGPIHLSRHSRSKEFYLNRIILFGALLTGVGALQITELLRPDHMRE